MDGGHPPSVSYGIIGSHGKTAVMSDQRYGWVPNDGYGCPMVGGIGGILGTDWA